MVIAVQLLIALVGILMYALCANPKLAEIGRILFFVGMLAFLLNVHAALSILGR
jgi:Na+/phosphate symporter